jgi:predicted signal transduction protein with EAL and GGDEF domain
MLFGSSVSVGISKIGDRTALQDLIVQADAALYVAKRSGRNRVILFSSREEIRRQKEGVAPMDLLGAEPDRANIYAAVAEAATRQSQRKGRLTKRI